MTEHSEIVQLQFKPPSNTRLLAEVLTVDDLIARAPAEHFQKVIRADFYRLIGVTSGATTLMVDFANYECHAMNWILIRPGQVLRYDFTQPWSGWLMVFRPDALFAHARSPQTGELDILRRIEDLSCYHTLGEREHAWLIQSVQQLQHDSHLNAEIAMRNEMLYLQLANSLLHLSLWQSTQDSSAATQQSALLKYKRFQQQLECDYATQRQVQHYAQALGLSEKTLSRVCRIATGMPAKACITQRIILESKRLLAYTNQSVHAIGMNLGFEDATNFVKFFRRETCTTPTVFRSASR